MNISKLLEPLDFFRISFVHHNYSSFLSGCLLRQLPQGGLLVRKPRYLLPATYWQLRDISQLDLLYHSALFIISHHHKNTIS